LNLPGRHLASYFFFFAFAAAFGFAAAFVVGFFALRFAVIGIRVTPCLRQEDAQCALKRQHIE
jgi:hypothetical protein